jgi:hypothetical protein
LHFRRIIAVHEETKSRLVLDLPLFRDEPHFLAWINPIFRKRLRQIERNSCVTFERLRHWVDEPLTNADKRELIRWARAGETLFSPREWVGLKLKLHSATLYHLIRAVPASICG